MNSCRICGSNKLQTFLSLGPTPLANSFLNESQLAEPEESFPLDACFCGECGLVQLGYVVPPEKMFGNYLYFTGTSPSMSEHYRQLAREIAALVPKGALAVEFASNDGTLLSGFAGTGVKALGVEPAENVAKAANEINGIETINAFFTEEVAAGIAGERGKAAAIIGTNVFAHIPDLHGAVKAVDALLADDGVLVLEFPYLADLLDKLEFDTIYHEHVSYFSLTPLKKLFAMHGMTITDARRLPVHGGSIRIFVKRKENSMESDNVKILLELEDKMQLRNFSTYEAFAEKIVLLKSKLLALLAGLKSGGKRIAAYGAAAKGSTLLNYFGIGRETLDFVADKSVHKQGLYTPGRHVKVVAPEEILLRKPDFVLILAWNLADEVMRELGGYEAAGGKFIVPVPEPRVT